MDRFGDTAAERIERIVEACKTVLTSGAPRGANALFLYGSALGPFFRADSDIDIAVLDREDNPLTWSEQARLMDALERAIGHGVDLRVLRAGSPSYQAYVLENGRLAWTRDAAEVEHFIPKALAAARRAREQSTREWPRVLNRLARLASPR